MQPAGWAAVREAAGRDVLAADLRCSFFASALRSYKRDSVLRPFPASYARHDCKDFEALVSVPRRPRHCVRAALCVEPVFREGASPALNTPSLVLGKVCFQELRTLPTP